MAKKYQSHPNAQVMGVSLLTITNSAQYAEFEHIAKPIFSRYGVEQIDPYAQYPMQLMFDLFREMQESGGAMFNFVAIGKQFAQGIPFQPEVTTLTQAMQVMNAMIKSTHGDVDESELYTVEQVKEDHVRIRDNTPMPHDIIFGNLHTLAQKFAAEGKFARVERIFDYPDDPDAGGATYNITWE